jgi:hypothetical protein
MSDLGGAIANAIWTLMTRSMFEAYFEQEEGASTVAATTHTGSVYMIEIAKGKPETIEYEHNTYWLRRGNVTANDKLHTDVYVGFNILTGTILVLDENREMIRRSSSIDRMELLASE